MVTLCQTFSQLWRGKLMGNPRDFSSAVQQLVTAVCFKLRRLQPCLISSLNVRKKRFSISIYFSVFSGVWSLTRTMSYKLICQGWRLASLKEARGMI